MKNKNKRYKTMSDTKKTEMKEQEVVAEENGAAANGVENAGEGQVADEQKELTREELM